MAIEQKGPETSVVFDHLKVFFARLKQGPSRGTLLVIFILLLVVGLLFVWRYFSSSSAQANSELWVKLDGVLFEDQLKSYIEDKITAGTAPGRIALLKEARRLMQQGIKQIGNPETQKEAKTNLNNASAHYQKLLSESSSPLLKQEALWSLAKAAESMLNLDEANRNYEQLAREFPNSVLGKQAQARLELSPGELRELRNLAPQTPE